MSNETIDIIEVKIPYPKSREENEHRYFCHASIKRYVYYPERFDLIKSHYLAYLQRQIERQKWLIDSYGEDGSCDYDIIENAISAYVVQVEKTQDLNELLALTPDSQVLRERHSIIRGISLIKAIK